jgi:periplasmic protein TonB
MQMDADAQAGGDAFGIGAGKGTGMGPPSATGTGTGVAQAPTISDNFYRRYLSGEMQAAIRDNDAINRRVFTAEVTVWIEPNGRLTRADVVRSTGDEKVDDQIRKSLLAMRALDAPPPSMRFPQRVSVRGRQSG